MIISRTNTFVSADKKVHWVGGTVEVILAPFLKSTLVRLSALT